MKLTYENILVISILFALIGILVILDSSINNPTRTNACSLVNTQNSGIPSGLLRCEFDNEVCYLGTPYGISCLKK